MGVVAIFTTAEAMTFGGNYRVLKVLQLLPRNDYILLMPKDRLNALRASVEKFAEGEELTAFLEVVNNAYELKPIGKPSGPGYVKYAEYVAKTAKELGAELVYYPHEISTYIHFGLHRSGMRWTALLQLTPIVGSLVVEEGRGFPLFYRNFKEIYRNASIASVLKSYARFMLFKYATRGVKLASVSASIPYELEKLGVKRDIVVLMPGVAVGPCPHAVNRSRESDVVYFARLRPENGLFEFSYDQQQLR